MFNLALDGSGMPERWLINAQLHGSMQGEGTNKRFVPDEITVGPGTMPVLQGLPITDPNTRTLSGYTTPNVISFEPMNPDLFERGFALAQAAFHDEVNQAHALMNSDATASGFSRSQAAADHENSAHDGSSPLERIIRDANTAALRLAFNILNAGSDQPFAALEPYRVQVTMQVQYAPSSPVEDENTRANHDASLIDREEAMRRIGVEDTGAMVARIELEREQDIKRGADQAAADQANAGQAGTGGQRAGA